MARAVRILVVAAWLGALGWLLATEIAPGWFRRPAGGYRALLAQAPLVADSWMRILVHGQPAGFSHTLVQSGDGGDESFRMENRTVLSLRVLDQPRRVTVLAGASLDPAYRLQRFSFALRSDPYEARAEGRRLRGRTFAVDLVTAAGTDRRQIEIPDDAVLYSPMTETLLGQLQPGGRLRLRTFDPISMTHADVEVRALRRETIRLGDAARPATLLLVAYRGMEVRTWIGPDGGVLRQETPFGWTLESCSAREAMDAARGTAGRDLLEASAVACAGELARPRETEFLRVRLAGAPGLAAMRLASTRQAVRVEADDAVVLEVRRDPPAAPAGAPPPEDPPRPEDSAATAFVQSDHDEIVRAARGMVAGRADPLARAEAIHDGVHRTVRKNPAVSLPSALDVLRRREGDCNEHAYLYVALARAAGLPARIRVGLVHHEGAFYYHAWPAAWVGDRWVDLDPTFGQVRADATHLALTEGELEGQLRLLAVVGRLRAEVLESR